METGSVETEVGPRSARITIQSPSGDRVLHLTDQSITVGRAPENDVSIADPRASRVHLRIEPRPGGHRVVDMGSQNGTFRNGRRVRSAAVRPGDVILEVDRESVESPGELARRLDDADEKILVLIGRGDSNLFVPMSRRNSGHDG